MTSGFWRLLHVAVPVAILGVGISLVGTLLAITQEKCATERNDLLPSYWLMGVGLAGLIAGFVFTLWDGQKTTPRHGGPHRSAGSAAWLFAFVILSGIWVFEAIGTAHVSFGSAAPQYEPITFYVRCAIIQDLKASNDGLGFWSPIIVFVIGGLVGHWLWPWRALPKGAAVLQRAGGHS